MKVAITGSTGFIGKHLSDFLMNKGVEVHAVKREHYLPDNKSKLISLLNGCDAVINLAGASINSRWTKENKQKIRDSRIKKWILDSLCSRISRMMVYSTH